MSKRTARIFVYHAKDGWRWRLKSSNGKIICESGESFVSPRNARESVLTAHNAFGCFELVVTQ